jgi:hypothetical protein
LREKSTRHRPGGSQRGFDPGVSSTNDDDVISRIGRFDAETYLKKSANTLSNVLARDSPVIRKWRRLRRGRRHDSGEDPFTSAPRA